MNKTIPLLGLLVSIILMSCDDKETQIQTTDLFDTEWNLYKFSDSIEGPFMIYPEENEDYWLMFFNYDSISAKDACNDCAGNFTMLDNNRIDIGLVCTEAACQGGSWIANIHGVYSFDLEGDTLILSSEYSRSDTDQHQFYFRMEKN